MNRVNRFIRFDSSKVTIIRLPTDLKGHAFTEQPTPKDKVIRHGNIIRLLLVPVVLAL